MAENAQQIKHIGAMNTKKAGLTCNELRQDSVSATVNETHRQGPSLTTTGAIGKPLITEFDDVRVEIITELPAARDCCSEKALDPVEHKQKMRQCINFLADEHAEVLSDFEEKLAALKNWLHKNHSHHDSDDEIKLLWHRAAYLIWIHEQRIQEDALQHFEWRLNSNSATTRESEKPVEKATAAKARIGKSDSSNLETPEMPERTKPVFAESIEAATEPYPPTPTVESTPATPVLPCHVPASPLSEAPQMGGFREQLQDIATTDSGDADYSIPVSPEMAKKFDLQPDSQPTQQQVLQMQQQMRMQQMAHQQHNALKRDVVVQTQRISEKPFRQHSSALVAREHPKVSRHDEHQHAREQTDSPRKDVEYDLCSSQQDNCLTTPVTAKPTTTSVVTRSEASGLDITKGAENCLAGLRFVFTGQFTYFSREDGQKLVRHYGGKWRTVPSKKTTYVVLGSEVDPSKLQYIKEHKLRTIDEEGLLNLIRRLPSRDLETSRQIKKFEKQKKAIDDFVTTTSSDQDYDSSSTAAGLRRWAQRAAEIKAKDAGMESWSGRDEWTSFAEFLEEHAAAAGESSNGAEKSLY